MGIDEVPRSMYQPNKRYIWQLMILSAINTTLAFIIYWWLAPTNIVIAWILSVLLGWFTPAFIFWFWHMVWTGR